MKTTKQLLAALGTAGISSLAVAAFSSPAQAETPICSEAGYSVTQLVALGSTGCQIGDKIYSNFSFTGLTRGVFAFTDDATDHTFSGAGLNFNNGSFSYQYDMKIVLPSDNTLFSYRTAATGSSTVAGGTFTKTLAADGEGTSTATQSSPENRGNLVLFNTTTQTATFRSTLTATNYRIDTITDSLTQQFDDKTRVPGPLSILGAATAFSFSRRLRSRIASTN